MRMWQKAALAFAIAWGMFATYLTIHLVRHELGTWFWPKSWSVPPQANKALKWPDVEAPCDGCGPIHSTNGYQHFVQTEVSPGKWQMVEDLEAEERSRKWEIERSHLATAFQTRALTDEEFTRVKEFGAYIFVPPMQSFNPIEIDAKYQAAMTFQYMARQKGCAP